VSLRPSDLLPGLLVAATGVGAGDLVLASLAGSELGVVVLWAAAAGAVLKVALNEGLVRWQLATGETLLEGWVLRLGRPLQWIFLAYLLVWSFVVGGALVSACGVAATSLVPAEDVDRARVAWGVAHSLAGLTLARLGGYRLFERVMSVCIAVMFLCVMTTAVLLLPEPSALARGLVPTIPEGGTSLVLGLLGGVGGTVTLLSYGYWIRERRRSGAAGLRTCRVDLAVAYAMTALFGMAMVVIGSRVTLGGSGADVAAALAGQLETALGPAGRVLFLVGFWGAVFSSLLGVWQGVPYLFADFVALRRGERLDPDHVEGTRAYRLFQLALAVVPLVLLGRSFRGVQVTYAVCGALFMPFLAGTLLLLNNRRDWVGPRFRNGAVANGLLILTLAFFGWTALDTLLGAWPR